MVTSPLPLSSSPYFSSVPMKSMFVIPLFHILSSTLSGVGVGLGAGLGLGVAVGLGLGSVDATTVSCAPAITPPATAVPAVPAAVHIARTSAIFLISRLFIVIPPGVWHLERL